MYQTSTEYGYVTYLYGNASLDRLLALDLIGMGAVLIVGYFALVIVGTCLKARRRYKRRMGR